MAAAERWEPGRKVRGVRAELGAVDVFRLAELRGLWAHRGAGRRVHVAGVVHGVAGDRGGRAEESWASGDDVEHISQDT